MEGADDKEKEAWAMSEVMGGKVDGKGIEGGARR